MNRCSPGNRCPSPNHPAIASSVGHQWHRRAADSTDRSRNRYARRTDRASGAKAQRSRGPDRTNGRSRIGAVCPDGVCGRAAVVFAWLWLGGIGKLPLAVVSAVSVLIVACPCALRAGDADVDFGRLRGGARRKACCFRDAEALERLALVTKVVLDKTGTLTEENRRWRHSCHAMMSAKIDFFPSLHSLNKAVNTRSASQLSAPPGSKPADADGKTSGRPARSWPAW